MSGYSTIKLLGRKYFYVIFLAVFGGIILICGLVIISRRHPKIVINEVCTSNIRCCEDENGNYPDWIELYNVSEEPVDISGYSLTKKSDPKKEKYTVPDGTTVAAGAFYLIAPGFFMSSEGCNLYLYDKGNIHMDHVKVPKLFRDSTYARSEDGGSDWSVRQPTPGFENAEGRPMPVLTDGKVTASHTPGFYHEPFDLELTTAGWGNSIYYTLDGSDPKDGGILYQEPIRIVDRSFEENMYSAIEDVSLFYINGETSLPKQAVDKCTTVRAVSKDPLGRFTDTFTFSYFVGFDQKTGYDDITVVSAVADPDDLFSHDNGILVLGSDYDDFVAAGEPEEYDRNTANFTRRGRASERDVNIEIFDNERKLVADTPAGIRIKGLSSRWDEQKSFSVFFRKGYSGSEREAFTTDRISYDVHSLALEKCGQDEETKMIDVIMNDRMKDSGCTTRDEVPAALFLNGEYWGFYWLTQRFDANYIADLYGVRKDNVEFMDMEDFDGDSAWNEENFDRDLLIKYYASNIITGHTGDWPMFNFRFWRTTEAEEGNPYADAKLRPVIFDMNSRSMDNPETTTYEDLKEFYPFKKLIEEDESFTDDLWSEISRMRGNEFETSRVLALIDDLYARMKDQMILDKMRYYGMDRDKAAAAFDTAVEEIRDFYINRGSYLDGIN